jgi:general stress protein 26
MEGTDMEQSTYRQQQFSKVDELIKDIRIAMLTTVDEDGSLRSRPMAAPQAAFDGALWFFTRAGTPEAEEAQPDRQVNVSFADPEHQRYVSISGTVTLVPDRQKMEALWSPWFRTWFPGGARRAKSRPAEGRRRGGGVLGRALEHHGPALWDGEGHVDRKSASGRRACQTHRGRTPDRPLATLWPDVKYKLVGWVAPPHRCWSGSGTA